MCPTLGKSVFEISEKTWSEIPIIRLYIELMKKNPPEAEDYKQFLPFLKMSEENMDNLIEQFKAQRDTTYADITVRNRYRYNNKTLIPAIEGLMTEILNRYI